MNIQKVIAENGVPSVEIARVLQVGNRVGAISKPHVSTPKSFTFVLKSTMNTKKWYLKVNNHPLIGFLVL